MNVKERADTIGTFRYIEVRLMETAAYWVPLTPEMEVKTVLGRHIWDFAQHADWLGKRTYELRQPEQYTRRAVDDYVALLDQLTAESETAKKLSMMYDVIVPGLIRRYERYLGSTDELLDGPSAVIIERILTDLSRQCEEAGMMRREIGIASVAVEALRDRETSIATLVA